MKKSEDKIFVSLPQMVNQYHILYTVIKYICVTENIIKCPLSGRAQKMYWPCPLGRAGGCMDEKKHCFCLLIGSGVTECLVHDGP